MDPARRWRGWRSQPRRRIREDARRRTTKRLGEGVRSDLDIHRRLKPGALIVLAVAGVAIAVAGVITTDWRGVGAGLAINAAALAFLWWDGG